MGHCDGMPLAYQLEGEGELVLLLNGGMMSIPAWEPVAADLRTRYRVMRCDFRGQLFSPGEPPKDLAGHAREIAALLASLNLGQAHVIGTSFGALVGAILAAEHPERVASLVIATAAEQTTDSLRRGSARLRAAIREIRGTDAGKFHDVLLEEVFSPAWAEANRELVAERRRQIGQLPPAWFAQLEKLLDAADDFDLRPLLGRIGCPTLVVAAAADKVMPIEHSHALVAGIAGSRLVVHPSAGHTLVVEDPGWLTQVCLEFLAQVTGRS